MIRILTLGLFALIMLDQYETQTHLALVLLTWVLFENIENFYRKNFRQAIKRGFRLFLLFGLFIHNEEIFTIVFEFGNRITNVIHGQMRRIFSGHS